MQRTTNLPRGVIRRREQRACRGDLVIITADRSMSMEAIARLREDCNTIAARSGVQFVVIDGGLTAQVIKGAAA